MNAGTIGGKEERTYGGEDAADKENAYALRANPKGIVASSPRLACNAYLRCAFGNGINANGVVARVMRESQNRFGRNDVAVEMFGGWLPKIIPQGRDNLGLWAEPRWNWKIRPSSLVGKKKNFASLRFGDYLKIWCSKSCSLKIWPKVLAKFTGS